MDEPANDAPVADWLVYGDSLQERGDPRGQLIALSHAVAEGTADASIRDAYVKEHAAALFTHAEKFLDSYVLEWRFCHVVAARVRIGHGDGDRDLMVLDAPVATALRAITLVGHTDGRTPVNLDRVMRTLLKKRPPSLRVFSFVDERAANASSLISRDATPYDDLVTFGSLQPFFPFAEEIHLHVANSHQLDISPMNAPELRAFTLNSLRFSEYDDADTMIHRLEDAALPKLERYAIRLTESWNANIPLEENAYLPVYSTHYAERAIEDEEAGEAPRPNRYEEEANVGGSEGVEWGVLADLLQLLAGCPLKHLALTGFESSPPLVEVLDAIGFAPTLETLDLSDSALDDNNAAWMVAHPARFAGLKRLIVERTDLTEAGAQQLRKLGPEIVFTPGRVSYRYIVGSE